MKVLCLAGDSGGCGFYRIFEPARVAKEIGVDVEARSYIDVEAERHKQTNLVTVLEIQEDVDLLVIQRPLSNDMTAIIEQAHKQGIATIVELDDDFDSIHAKNIVSSMPKVKWEGPQWISKAAAIADHVIVSTPRLLKYAPHKRATVLRNYVPKSIFDIEPVSLDNPILGWTGTTQTHPMDLQVTKGRIGDLIQDYKIPFHIVGDGKDVQKFLHLPKETDFKFTGWVNLDKYYKTISETFNIGIVPLEISQFNQSKSALKGLEYASLGIPFIASNTSEYELLETYGVGKTVTTPNQWYKFLSYWLDNPNKLQEAANKYRDILYNNYTYEQHASDWANVWEQTISYRKGLIK